MAIEAALLPTPADIFVVIISIPNHQGHPCELEAVTLTLS